MLAASDAQNVLAVPKRLVELKGRPADFTVLAQELKGHGAEVVVEGGVTYLHAVEIDNATTIEDAIERAKRLVTHANGAATVFSHVYQKVIGVDIVEARPDGATTRYSLDMVPRLAGIYFTTGHPPLRAVATTMTPTGQLVTVTGTDGVPRQPPPRATIAEWVEMASTDPDSALALEMIASDASRWAALYRAVEAIKQRAGSEWRAVVGDYLATKEEIFSHTANAPTPRAVDKRHPPKHQPPKEPMTLVDAELFVRQMLAAFLEWRRSRVATSRN
jgi:hypothetical protein